MPRGVYKRKSTEVFIQNICPVCKEEFSVSTRRLRKYCSRKCIYLDPAFRECSARTMKKTNQK